LKGDTPQTAPWPAYIAIHVSTPFWDITGSLSRDEGLPRATGWILPSLAILCSELSALTGFLPRGGSRPTLVLPGRALSPQKFYFPFCPVKLPLSPCAFLPSRGLAQQAVGSQLAAAGAEPELYMGFAPPAQGSGEPPGLTAPVSLHGYCGFSRIKLGGRCFLVFFF